MASWGDKESHSWGQWSLYPIVISQAVWLLQSVFPFSGRQVFSGKEWMHTQMSSAVRHSHPRLEQITSKSRALPSSVLSGMNHFHVLPLNPSLNIENIFSPFLQTLISELPSIRKWGGMMQKALFVLYFFSHEHRSLVSISVNLILFTNIWVSDFSGILLVKT